ncbi:AroM protein [Salmonella enterica subsp. enterica serovar Daytona]|uniref:AroM protein n=1 Tax=Salmonella enterica subsp. enterica serovar Daytona TaxID=1962639 RepID=A0A447JMG1_SALET|nr:AroM protein [Salmonella enterica subsp. enterica serovar Daytona]
MAARNSILLEPLRIIPPLVASIVDGHQVGVIVPVAELLAAQEKKMAGIANAAGVFAGESGSPVLSNS